MAPKHTVRKQGMRLSPSALTINPDLIFDGGQAVGDVKYKLGGADWQRSDLYQATAFSTAFGCSQSIVVGFRGTGMPPNVLVGPVSVRYLAWDHVALAPERAALDIVEKVRSALEDA